MIERKFTPLKDLKVIDEGSGYIEGYRSVFGEIDEGGDIVIKGAFAAGMSEYLHAGFTAQSHDWDFDKAVGFPVEAKEDDYGWWVKSQFHSTPDSQNIRIKAKERMEAGKQVGFSFGYSADSYQHIEQKDYEKELPQYIKPERLEENMRKAQKFSRIRILKQVGTIEDSLVTAGMNKLAAATAVKSDINKELSEDQIKQILEQANDDFYLKVIAASESFESFDKAAPAALGKFIDNMKRNHEARVKEGRVLSSSNRATVQKCKDSLTALMGDLDALLLMSEPKPKEKSIDIVALRTQAERVRNNLLRDFQ
jgi:HK97 family phage prohead protease